MSQRSAAPAPAPFLRKTYEMIDDGVTNEIISWDESGNSFVVWKTAEFASDLLPKYFKHNNFSSFIRQLNTYGFRKIVPNKWEFANENFKRGEFQLMATIKRRKPQTPIIVRSIGGGPTSATNSGAEDMGSTSSERTTEQIYYFHCIDLSNENERLKRNNEELTVELARAKKRCKNLVALLNINLNAGPGQVNRVRGEGTNGSSRNAARLGGTNNAVNESEGEIKLFGVWMKKRD